MAYEFGTNWARFSDKAGRGDRPADGLRGDDGILPRSRLPRHHAVRPASAWDAACHFAATMLVAIGTLISAFWILAANSWMQTPQGHTLTRGWPLPARGLVADHLQSVLPLSPRAHGDRVLSVGRVRGGRGRRLASAARCAEPGGAADVLDGDVDGGGGGADPDPRRRPARTEHARAPAGEDRRARGRLGNAAGHAADPVRHARHGE